jgi:hypothetical protein
MHAKPPTVSHSVVLSSYEQSQNGTTFLTVNSTTGAGCRWKFGYLVVERPTFYDIGKANFTIQPWEVKLEVHVNCPWEAEVRAINTSLAPTQEIFLRARQMRPLVTVNFNFTEPIIPTQTQVTKGFEWDPSYMGHARNSCLNAMPSGLKAIPPYALPDNFNYSAVGSMRVPTETVIAGFSLLGWAFVDGEYYADVAGKINQSSLAFTANSITGFADLKLMFANGSYFFFIPLPTAMACAEISDGSIRTILRPNIGVSIRPCGASIRHRIAARARG